MIGEQSHQLAWVEYVGDISLEAAFPNVHLIGLIPFDCLMTVADNRRETRILSS